MNQKKFYYTSSKFDIFLIIAIVEFILLCTICMNNKLMWSAFIITLLVWICKHFFKHPAVIITDKNIKIDFSQPISWTDIENAEIKEVRLCGKNKKILSLNPKKDIQYKYSYLQKNNCDFGPFPIPLYGILSKADEKEITTLVQEKVKLK